MSADRRTTTTSYLSGQCVVGDKGAEMIDGHNLVRETVGGRTTAWAPDIQK